MNLFTRSIAVPILVVLSLSFISFGCGSSGGRGTGPGIPSIQVAEPAVDRPAGYFVDPIDVTLSPGTAGTFGDTIELTTDGSVPSCGSGTAYVSTTVTISTTAIVKAVACMDGYDDSDVLVATYTEMLADTRVSPGAGTPIQDAIDAAATGDVIYIEPGTYTENNGQVTINKRVTLIGAGSGDDPASNTIVSYADSRNNVISITVGGASTTSRLAVRNLQVTGSHEVTIPGGNYGTGILIQTIGEGQGHIEFDNVAAVYNSGNGIAFDVVATEISDIVVRNCNLSFNGNHGFRNPSSLDHINGLTVDNTTFEGNAGAGLLFYYMGYEVGGSTNVFISNSTFAANATTAYQLADIIFSSFNGNATLSSITITSDLSDSGIRITGKSNGRTALAPAGNMTLSNVNISGVQQTNGAYPSAALFISRYLGLSGITMNNVVLGSDAPNGLFLGTIAAGASTVPGAGSSPDLGNLAMDSSFSDYDIKLGTHGNDSANYDSTSIAIDATGVTFQGALTDQDIEDRIWHNVDEAALGLVTWTTP